MGRLRFLTAGESHGRALGVIVEGVPAGLALTAEAIAARPRAAPAGLRSWRPAGDRARPGGRSSPASVTAGPSARRSSSRSRTGTGRTGPASCRSSRSAEADAAELLAAADGGNKRATPVTRVRPGHADLAGALKYGFNDVRNVLERASARETAARVAAGGVARAFLAELGVDVWSFTAEVGGVALDPGRATRSRDEADASPAALSGSGGRGADDRPDRRGARRRRHGRRASSRSSPTGCRSGWARTSTGIAGSTPPWPAAVMSINIVKGVEFGLGFEQTRRFGSAVHDVIEGRAERRPLDPPIEQRRRADRRRHERRAARRARRGQADLDPGPTAPVGRPAHRARRSTRPTTSGATSASCRPPGSSARRWSCSPSPTSCSTSSAATRSPRRVDNLARYRDRIARAPEAPVAGGRRGTASATVGDGGEAGSGGDD